MFTETFEKTAFATAAFLHSAKRNLSKVKKPLTIGQKAKVGGIGAAAVGTDVMIGKTIHNDYKKAKTKQALSV
jgi:hypothetical protein